MKKLIALTWAISLAACGQTEDTGEPSPESDTSVVEESEDVELASTTPLIPDPVEATGGFLRTFADGSQQINIWRDDMTFYHANQVNSPVGNWSGEGNKVCFDPHAAGRDTHCRTFGTVGANGTFSATSDDGHVLIATRLDRDLAPGEQAMPEAGVYLLEWEDGEQFISINSADGTYHGATVVGNGTYRIEDGKRCAQMEGSAEGCETLGEWQEDSSFEGTLQQGTSFEVKQLL